jgi:oligopeptide transport system ATP-binding protein
MAEKLLDVKDLQVTFKKKRRAPITPLRGVSLSLERGEILGVVGESGCGKSLTAKAIVGLVGKKRGEQVTGQIRLGEEELTEYTDEQMRRVRGKKIAMIFQDPMTSLNPVLSIGYQVAEGHRIHEKSSKNAALERAIEILDDVGIPSARERLGQYPHQFSGGMRQRVVSAISLICEPEILIADEPTTALDVTIQNQFLDLLVALKEKLGTSIVMITHDLGVVAKLCDRVQVMYAGRVIERAANHDLYKRPTHPYTRGLLNSVPVIGSKKALEPIEGQPPNPEDMPGGCAFHPRCRFADETCKQAVPILEEIAPGHEVACFKKEVLYADTH